LKQISLKGDVKYGINHKAPIFYEIKVKKNLMNLPKKFCEFPP